MYIAWQTTKLEELKRLTKTIIAVCFFKRKELKYEINKTNLKKLVYRRQFILPKIA